MALAWPFKDPNEVLDYQIDWSDRLDGDTIDASTWAFASGDGMLVMDSDSFTGTTTTLWLSGGTLNATYEVTNHITTDGGREMDQTAKIKLKSK
jgi:hypothetical protein